MGQLALMALDQLKSMIMDPYLLIKGPVKTVLEELELGDLRLTVKELQLVNTIVDSLEPFQVAEDLNIFLHAEIDDFKGGGGGGGGSP